MSKVKKWVAFIVMVCLLTTIMPVNAFADSTTESPICGMEEGTNHTHTEACYQNDTSTDTDNVRNTTTYQVSDADSFNTAIQSITSSKETEAVIEITQDISGVSFVGVADKKITLKSTDENKFEFSSVGSNIVGDITLDNVSAKLSLKIYANGHTFETTERFSISDKTISYYDVKGRIDYLFGGGYTGNDVNGDTNLIIRGDFQAEWIFGGGYNSDVSGDTNILIDGSNVWVGNLYGGGHFGDNTNTGKYDPTATAQVAKDTNVTVNVGTFGSVFGGGYNQRCDMQYSSNAKVVGTANVILGQENASDYIVKAGYATASHGGSFFSEVGNVQVMIYSGVNFNARGDNTATMYGAGISDIVHGTIKITVDAHSGKGTLIDDIIGTGDYSPSYNDLGSFSQVLNETREENAVEIIYNNVYEGFINGGITTGHEDTEGNYNGQDVINGNVLVKMLKGDVQYIILDSSNYNGIITGNANVWVEDANIGYVRGNANLYSDTDGPYESNVTISNSKDTIFGYFYKIHNLNVKDGSDILIDSDELNLFSSTQNPFYSTNNLTITGNSQVETRNSSTSLKANVAMSENSTWIANGYTYVYGSMTTENSTIHFKNYYQIGYGYKDSEDKLENTVLTSENDTFIADYNVYLNRIHGNVCVSDSNMAFMSRTYVDGHWTANEAKLYLPAINAGKNYDGTEAGGNIPLNIDGIASGKTTVYTVSSDNWQTLQKPTLGDNYITGFKTNNDKPAQSVFVLGNEDAVQEGYYLKRLADPGNTEQYFMWQVAKDERISIQPARVTIYMGGDGYEGTVDADGQLITGSDQIKKNGFPEPGFLITLPEALKDLSIANLYLQYKDEGTTYQWKFEKYGEGDHNVYRIVPYGDTETRSVRMQFTRTLDDEQTETVTNDNFDVAKYINETLTMKVYGEGIEEHKVNFVYDEDGDGIDNDDKTYDIAIQDGTLTVRGTTSAVQTAPVNEKDSFTATKDQLGITAPEGTTYTINGSEVQVDDTTGISLLFDNIIDSNAGDENATYTDLLKAKVDDTLGDGDENRQYEYKYLDLVDTHNGNAWVAANKAVTVYWPLPEGADADADFTLLHFQDLHRSMSPTDITNKLTADNYTPEEIQSTVEGDHIVFDVQPYNNGSGGFSPYVLVWEDESGDGGEDTPSTPVTPPDGDDTPDLNTTDHFSYVVGYEDGMVKPEKAITRAEVATIFYRLLKDDVRAEYWTKSNDFTDVEAGDWYNTTVSTLNAMGIITGYEDGSFKPNAPITRAEFAAMAVRFFEEDSAIYEEGTFNDIAGSEWFADAVQAAKDHSIIGGYPDGSFQPNKNISRAEACSIINRTLDRIPDADHLLPEDLMKNWPDNNPGDWYYADMQEATNGHEYEWITDDGKTVENWTGDREEIDWAKVEEELEAMHGEK